MLKREVKTMYDIDKEHFGKFIGELRKEKGMTQKELAERLLVSSKAISKWETGANLPDIALLVPLADILGVTVTELLECQRNTEQQNPEVERAVRKAIQIANVPEKKSPLVPCFVASCILCLAELIGLKQWMHPQISDTIWYLMGSIAFIGGYACLFMRKTLPSYYDENRIYTYSYGMFRMNLVGLSFNNSNWPYIVQVIRIWAMCMLVGYPLISTMILSVFEQWIRIASIVLYAISFGSLVVLVYYFGKKYE